MGLEMLSAAAAIGRRSAEVGRRSAEPSKTETSRRNFHAEFHGNQRIGVGLNRAL